MLGVAVFFWASAFAGIRLGLEACSPGHVAIARLMVASIALFIYALVTRMPLPKVRGLPVVALGGFLVFPVYHVVLCAGEVTVSSGPERLLVSMDPAFRALLATAFLWEPRKVLGWVGMGATFVGASIIGLWEGENFHIAPVAFIIFIAAVSVSIYLVMQKAYLAKYGVLNFTSYAI